MGELAARVAALESVVRAERIVTGIMFAVVVLALVLVAERKRR